MFRTEKLPDGRWIVVDDEGTQIDPPWPTHADANRSALALNKSGGRWNWPWPCPEHGRSPYCECGRRR